MLWEGMLNNDNGKINNFETSGSSDARNRPLSVHSLRRIKSSSPEKVTGFFASWEKMKLTGTDAKVSGLSGSVRRVSLPQKCAG